MSFAIAFALLYFIVSKFALPRVGGIISNREGVIENDLAKAQKLKDESDQALKAYETELADARARAQAIGSETRDKLNAQAESDRKALETAFAAQAGRCRKDHCLNARNRDGQCPLDRIGRGQRRSFSASPGVAPDSKTVDSAVDASLKG